MGFLRLIEFKSVEHQTCHLIPKNGLLAKIGEPKTRKNSLNKTLQKLNVNGTFEEI